jgi:hypothetical protein
MSEKRRAFLALQGQTFPCVGDRGLYKQFAASPSDTFVTPVKVLDVTESGFTVTVRFVRSAMRTRFGVEKFVVHRRGELFDGTGWYLPKTRVLHGGEVSFSPSGFVGPTSAHRASWGPT